MSVSNQPAYIQENGNIKNMPRDYLHEGEYKLALELRLIERQVQEPNRSYMLGYKRFLELNNRKAKTIGRRLLELRQLLKILKKDAKKATKEDIESLALYINRSDRVSLSKDKMRLVLKNFYKWLYNSEEYPDLVKWIKLTNCGSKRLPAEVLLTEDDIRKMLEVCRNQRDKAVIALLWDTGMRVGELLNLKIHDVTLQKDGISYARISGKTGDRRTPIVFSVPYIVNYLTDLRRYAKPTDSLFVIIDHGKVTERTLDYPSILKILIHVKERSGITKRIYPHLFRHSRATFYATSMTEHELKSVFGWTGSSNMAAIYVHLSGRDIDNAVLKANGILDSKSEPIMPKLTIKKCYKCQDINEATARYCIKCGSPLDLTPIQQLNESEFANQRMKKMEEALGLLAEKLDKQTNAKVSQIIEEV